MAKEEASRRLEEEECDVEDLVRKLSDPSVGSQGSDVYKYCGAATNNETNNETNKE